MAVRASLVVLLAALAASSAQARPDPAAASQREFLLRHYFMGPSETSGWGPPANRGLEPGRRLLGPHRPAYFTSEGLVRRGDRTAAQLAALDLAVRPKRSSVLVGERPVGPAKRFDGLPRWLWLESGTTQLTLIGPDGERVTQRLELRPGSVTRLEADLD